MFKLRDGVEFPFSVHFRINIIEFIFCGHETVLNLHESSLDGFLICLGIIPFYDSLVELPFHIADTAVVLIQNALILPSLNDLLTLQVLFKSNVS